MATDFGVVLRQLQAEERTLDQRLSQVRQAIEALSQIGGAPPRRGRPARGSSSTSTTSTFQRRHRGHKRRRRKMSAEARAKIGAAQRKRWAALRAKPGKK